jgi:putative transposase
MNLKKLRRLYGEEKLQVRKRGGRKRALGSRRPMILPDRPNRRWSLDSSVTASPMAVASGC